MIKRAALIFFTLITLGCNLFYIEEDNSLTISITNDSRTITPELVPLDSYTIKFNSGEEKPLKGAVDTIENIIPGNYKITVYGYSNGKLLAKQSVENFQVKSGSNSLPIKLEYLRVDSGELSLDINWENSSVNSITVLLTDLSDNNYIPVDITNRASIDLLGRTLSMSSNIDSGDYLLSIKFKNGTNTLLLYNEVVQIYKNLSSICRQNFLAEEFNSKPEAPENLAVLERARGFKLEWKDASNRETSYKVERADYSNGSFGSWHTLDDLLFSNTESYLDSSANNSMKYKYRVTAINSFGSSTGNEVTTKDTTPPTPGTITLSSRTVNSVNLEWTKSNDNLSDEDEIKYSLYYSKDYTTIEDIVTNGSNPVAAQIKIYAKEITGLNSNSKYYFVLKVEDKLGNSAYYPTLEVTMSSDTTPPLKPLLRGGGEHTNQIRVYWDPERDNTSDYTYKLYYSTTYTTAGDIEAYGILHSEYAPVSQDVYIKGLDAITHYLVLVVLDKAQNKTYSNVLEQGVAGVSLDKIAPEVGTLSVLATGSFDVTLEWSQANDPGNPSSLRENLVYQIYYTDKYTLPEEIVQHGKMYNRMLPGTTIDTNLSHKVDSLIYGTRYYFVIKVSDEMGNYSLYKAVNTQTTIPDVLPDIRIKEVTPGERAIHVDLDQEVTIYFYDELSPDSVDNISVYANRVDINSSWETTNVHERVNGTISYNEDERAILFIPDKEIPFKDKDDNVVRNTAFKQGEVYQITIENVSSLGGETISWDFRFKTLDYSIFTSHWKFDNNGKDSSGKNRDLNQINASYTKDMYKEGTHSISLNGSQNAIINDLMLGEAFTVTAWVNMDTPMQESLNTIIANASSLEKSNGFKLCVNKWYNPLVDEGDLYNGLPNLKADKRIVIEVGNGTYGGKFLTDPNFVIPGGWFHLAFTIDKPNKIMKIYFDGLQSELYYTSEDNGTITPAKEIFDAYAWDFKTDGKFYFGSFFDSTDYGFKGKIDDMRAYNTVLSDEDIKQIATQNY